MVVWVQVPLAVPNLCDMKKTKNWRIEVFVKLSHKNAQVAAMCFCHVRYTKKQWNRLNYLLSNINRSDYYWKRMVRLYPNLYQLPF